MILTLSYRHVLLLLPSIVYVSGGNGHSRPPRHLKTKFTPLNRAVRSLSTHPTANLAPAATSLPTWRGEHLNSPLCLRSSLSISCHCLYRGFLTRVPGHPSLEQIILNKFAVACYAQISFARASLRI